MKLLFPLFLVCIIDVAHAQNVGINTSTPQAALDISSTTQGFLPPRLTIIQRDQIENPVAGLTVFCSDCDEIQVYNGTIWKNMTGKAACTEIIPVNVTICNQTWMLKNLNVSNYRNGDPIPQVTDDLAWDALTTGAWCYYNNDSATYAATYGKLYNWYAVNDPRGLAPQGWHIPSDSEWTILSNCMGGDQTCGGFLKETGFAHWQTPNTAATNTSGFTALPGGTRHYNGLNFTFNGSIAVWWTTTEDVNQGTSRMCYLYYQDHSLGRSYFYHDTGFSVRCIRN